MPHCSTLAPRANLLALMGCLPALAHPSALAIGALLRRASTASSHPCGIAGAGPVRAAADVCVFEAFLYVYGLVMKGGGSLPRHWGASAVLLCHRAPIWPLPPLWPPDAVPRLGPTARLPLLVSWR